jgi:CRP-like cAMP-binding protein
MNKISNPSLEPLTVAMRGFNPSLTDEEVKMVTDFLRPKVMKRGDFFIRENEFCKGVAFTVTGAFRQFYVKDETEVNTNFILENDFLIAYQSMLKNEPSRYYIQALEESEILVYPTFDIEQLYTSTLNWERYGRMVSRYLFLKLSDQLESTLFSSVKERYDNLLKVHPEWFERIPLKYLASYLGMQIETLSRLRSKRDSTL